MNRRGFLSAASATVAAVVALPIAAVAATRWIGVDLASGPDVGRAFVLGPERLEMIDIADVNFDTFDDDAQSAYNRKVSLYLRRMNERVDQILEANRQQIEAMNQTASALSAGMMSAIL